MDVLNTEEGVILGNTLATSRGTSFDLANTKSDRKIGDDSVLSLSAAMGDHDTPAVGLCKLSTTNIKDSQRWGQ